MITSAPPESGSDPRAAVHDWLAGEARRVDSRALFVAALGERLLAAGLPVARITTAVPLLHPILDTSSVIWEPDGEPLERLWLTDPRAYANSPLRIIYEGGGPVRHRITPDPVAGEFTIIPDLRAAGIVDYIALPAPFSDGTAKGMTFATRAADGFSDEDLAFLESLMPALSMILEIQTLRRTTRTFLDTYLGSGAGGRVLDGTVKRGMGETIPCAILFCDLRGFTDLSVRLDGDALLALLNAYFDAVCGSVEAHGGEVLKFMGDAVLAVFAHGTDENDARSARRAFDAAMEAQARLDALNGERAAAGEAPIRCGMALHVGDVLYGNIGSESRLDFTVLGPAVNLASRIEKLCGALGEPVLLSAALAALIEAPLRAAGEHVLKGVAGPQAVFAPGPADADAPAPSA